MISSQEVETRALMLQAPTVVGAAQLVEALPVQNLAWLGQKRSRSTSVVDLGAMLRTTPWQKKEVSIKQTESVQVPK